MITTGKLSDFHLPTFVWLFMAIATNVERANCDSIWFFGLGETAVELGSEFHVGRLQIGREGAVVLGSRGVLANVGREDGKMSPIFGPGHFNAVDQSLYHIAAIDSFGNVRVSSAAGASKLAPPSAAQNIADVAAGRFHIVAVTRSGIPICWGFAGDGRLRPPALNAAVVGVDAGRDHTVAALETGAVVAWGLNDHGQCDVPGSMPAVRAVCAGSDHTLALTEDGHVIGWGSNEHGQLNIPHALDSVIEIAAGDHHSLALKSNGEVVAWGSNEFGQLNVSRAFPCRLVAAKGAVSAVVPGRPLGVQITPQVTSIVEGEQGIVQCSAPSARNPVYRWSLNGVVIPDALGPVLTIDQARSEHGGTYAVLLVDEDGSVGFADAFVRIRSHGVMAAPRTSGSGTTLAFRADDEGIDPGNVLNYRLERSRDLRIWEPIHQTPVFRDKALHFNVPDKNGEPSSFYRVRSVFP